MNLKQGVMEAKVTMQENWPSPHIYIYTNNCYFLNFLPDVSLYVSLDWKFFKAVGTLELVGMRLVSLNRGLILDKSLHNLCPLLDF